MQVTLTSSNVPDAQALPVRNIGKKSITTIINAVSVVAGGDTGYIACGLDGTEDEVWVAVSIDQQPWSLFTKNIFTVGSAANNYPSYVGKTTTFAVANAPALSLVMGVNPGNQGLTVPASMADARSIKFPLDSGTQAYVSNLSAATATVTVKVIRIWR